MCDDGSQSESAGFRFSTNAQKEIYCISSASSGSRVHLIRTTATISQSNEHNKNANMVNYVSVCARAHRKQ